MESLNKRSAYKPKAENVKKLKTYLKKQTDGDNRGIRKHN